MTEVTATPAAPEAPVTPAAPATPATPEAPAGSIVKNEPASLVDGAQPPATPPATPPASPAEGAWYLTEGVAGQGEAPEWFKADKYKSVDEQAKAYAELEKRFGSFTGSPKDGVYKINPPEGIQVEFDTEHPLFQELNKFAKESQMSQQGYDSLISMWARYEAAMLPDMGEIKKQVGDNADARLGAAMQWAKSNLTEEQYGLFREAQTGANAAAVFKAMEAIIAKTRQPAMPKPNEDVPGMTAGGLADINARQVAVNPKTGKRFYEEDQKYRESVEADRIKFYQAQEKAAQR